MRSLLLSILVVPSLAWASGTCPSSYSSAACAPPGMASDVCWVASTGSVECDLGQYGAGNTYSHYSTDSSTGAFAAYGTEGSGFTFCCPFTGGTGEVTVYGSAGDDAIDFSNAGPSSLAAAFDLHAWLGDGDDRLLAPTTANTETWFYGEGGDDTYQGYGSRSHAWGGDDSDVLRGSGLDDELYGEGGDDFLYGMAGVDVLGGGDDDDLLCGGLSGDVLFGGDGADIVDGNAGVDWIDGGSGSSDECEVKTATNHCESLFVSPHICP
jgi:Ca2+-binding RTX toxin-like protein